MRMKTLLHLLFTLLSVCPLAMQAQDVTFNVTVDNPDAATLRIAGVENPLVAGDNSVTGAVGSIVRVEPKSGYLIKSVTDPQNNSMYITMDGAAQGYVYPEWAGGTLSVTTISEADQYPLSCTLNVDNASRVTAYMQNSFRNLSLVDGAQTLRFNDTDNVVVISSNSFAEPLYKVTQNGHDLEGTAPFYITLADGDVIDVQADGPAVFYNFRLSFANEGTQSVLDKFWVDGELVEDLTPYLAAEGVDLKGNTRIQFSFNTNDYKINAVTLNGQPLDFYTFNISEPSSVVIDARLWEHPTKHVYIEGAEYLEMYAGYSSYGGIPVEVKEGLNDVVYAEDYVNYCVFPKRDCHLTALRMGDKDLLADWMAGQTYFDISQEGDLYIKAEAYEFDKQFILYIDDIAAADFGFSFIDVTYQPMEATSGYNTVAYYDLIKPFNISAMAFEDTPVMYLDDELLTDTQVNDYQWLLDPVNNSVYKLFIASKPEKFDFSVTNDEGLEITVMRDIVVPVTDFTKPLSLLPGTRIDIEAPAGKTVAVSLNGAEPVEVDKYSTVVNEAGSLAITSGSALSAVTTDGDTVRPVYNLQGIRLTDSIDNLPAGLYIIGGHKILKK